jgi:nucleosome assembly protein 1-like 1
LMKCEATRVYITEKDAEVLKFLTNIEAESMVKDEQLQGFKLNFIFAANPFFSQTVLEKSYFMLPDNDGVLEKAEGTKIEWSAGKDVTVKLMKKKAKKGSKPSAKPEMKTEKVDSFFNFFDPPKIPEEEDDIDDEAMEELQATVEGDYELGAVIREKLVPDAAAWYTGEAAEDEDMMGYDYGEDEEFEGEDDEAEEGVVADPKQQPPECKQQ